MARGADILFMDADLATDLSGVPLVLASLRTYDVAIGSRAHPEATVTGRSPISAVRHHAFRAHAQRRTGITASDPQCGFKGFRQTAARLLFERLTLGGFGFDVELLVLAKRLGLRVTEVPVDWRAVPGSKIRPRDTFDMVLDVRRIRRRHLGLPRPENVE